MITDDLTEGIIGFVRSAGKPWIRELCDLLLSSAATLPLSDLIRRFPSCGNPNAFRDFTNIAKAANGQLSWQALGAAIHVCADAICEIEGELRVDLLWSGPSPLRTVAARRIDQVLYDLIDSSKSEILLVTFAANKIQRLTTRLTSAIERGVRVRLILEFKASSEGNLSMDALCAFPAIIREQAQIFYWPLINRRRNRKGNPGKLHAKAAVIDGQAVLSSANLTEDAFDRNLELGALFVGGPVPDRLRAHFNALISNNTLLRWVP